MSSEYPCNVVWSNRIESNRIKSKSQAKCYFYVRDAVTRDSVESQRTGVIFVADVSATMNRDNSGRLCGVSSINYSAQFYAMTKKMIESVPSRMVVVHSCSPDIPGFRVFNFLNVLVKNASSSAYAMRVRAQAGKQTEMRYKLKGYGIPIHLLPLTETGTIKLKYFNEWLRIRITLEKASEGDFSADDNVLCRVVVCPCLADVVFRQGTPSMKNPGNVMFRDTMIAHLEDHHNQHRYLEGHQQQPEQIEIFCNWLIDTIVKTKGGRFLEWDKHLNVWVKMVNHEKIKNKVAIAYRDTTRRFLAHRQKAARAVQQAAAQESSSGREASTTRDSSPDGRAYAFVEGERKGKEECCNPPKRLGQTGQTINGVPVRGHSNYSDTSCWF
jgi:hypothetical protein